MKAAQYNEYGGPDVIAINDVDKPIPKAGQALVEVKAAAINPFDWKVRSGAMKEFINISFPVTVGADFAGVISEVMDSDSDLKPGDEVYGSATVLNGGSGAAAQYAAVNITSMAPKPKSLDFTEAAALVLVGVSVVQVVDQFNLAPGQKVLIHGGAGGIGSAAIQYAKSLGAYVATAVRASDADFVKDLGADEVIDYETQQFEDVLSGYDAVFDTIGGETYARSFKVLKPGGTIISMNEQPNEQLMNEHGVKSIYQSTKVNTQSLGRLTEAVNSGAITPKIDREFPLEQTAEAFEHLESGAAKGKVVLKTS